MPALRGSQHHSAKLTEDTVKAIRENYSPGQISYRDLAEQHGVTAQLIAQVVSRKAWKWLD